MSSSSPTNSSNPTLVSQHHNLIPVDLQPPPSLQDIGFAEFSLHLSLGIVLCMLVAYGVLGIMTRTYVKLRNKDPPHIAEMKREIAIWERTASQMPVVSLEERAVRDALRAKANEVRNQLNQEEMMRCVPCTCNRG